MRHHVIITFATLFVAMLFYFAVDLIFNDSRAAVGTLTITGLTSLVLFSAFDSNELKRGS